MGRWAGGAHGEDERRVGVESGVAGRMGTWVGRWVGTRVLPCYPLLTSISFSLSPSLSLHRLPLSVIGLPTGVE